MLGPGELAHATCSDAPVPYFTAAAAKDDPNDAARRRVLVEYAGLVQMLTREVGVRVHMFSHSDAHGTPDAVFPNNWFSTSQDGVVVLYPMKTPNRRAERRDDLINFITNVMGASPSGADDSGSGGSGGDGDSPPAAKRTRHSRYSRDKLIDLTSEELPDDSGARILEGTGSLVGVV